MGLPFWPDEVAAAPADGAGGGWAAVPAVPAPEQASEALSTLANPVRLQALAALHRDGALSYTELRTAVGLEDKGLFNYHLRELDALVESDDGTYALTGRPERVVDGVLSEPVLESGSDG